MTAAILLIKRWWPLLIVLAAFAAGWKTQQWRCVAAAQRVQAAALAATITAYETAQKAAAQESAALEGRLAELDRQNRTLTRRHAHETRKDAYRCLFPADGNRLFNEGRAAVPVPETTGEPDR